MKRRAGILAAGAVATAAGLVLTPLAVAASPFFTIRNGSGAVSSTFQPAEDMLLTGGEWGPSHHLVVSFTQPEAVPRNLGSVTTSPAGTFSLFTNVPVSALAGPARVTVAMATATVTRSQDIHILGAIVPTPEPPRPREPDERLRDRAPVGQQQQQQQQGGGDGQQQQQGDGQQQQQQQQVVNVADTRAARPAGPAGILPKTGTSQSVLFGGSGGLLLAFGTFLLFWAWGLRKRPPEGFVPVLPPVGELTYVEVYQPASPVIEAEALPGAPAGGFPALPAPGNSHTVEADIVLGDDD